MSDYDNSPSSPNSESLDKIMKEQEEKLLQSKLKKPLGRPLLQGNRAKNRTYWDSTQEGAFSKSVVKNDDQLTIVGKIQRTKLHAPPEYNFNNNLLIDMKTERCLLKPIDSSSRFEIEMIVELFADVNISRNIPGPLTDVTVIDTPDKAVEFAKKSNKDFIEHKTGLMSIFDKNTNVLIGVTGIFPIVVRKDTKGRLSIDTIADSDSTEIAFEISFALLQKAWGKGFATECVLALEDLISKLSIDKSKVFAYIDTKQCRSDHVLKKIGMQKISDSVEYRGEEGVSLFGFNL